MAGVTHEVYRSIKQSSRLDPRRSAAIHRSYSFINVVYESHPEPVNVTTLTPTKDALFEATHPYHIKVSRRVAGFDRDKFHWRTVASIDLCKKAMIRSTAARRVANAFALRLKESGYERNGQRLQADGKSPLRGALFVKLRAEPASLQSSKEELSEVSDWLLKTVISMQERASNR
nr:hypothetical protein CFP56_07407 [Quercus suber]